VPTGQGNAPWPGLFVSFIATKMSQTRRDFFNQIFMHGRNGWPAQMRQLMAADRRS